MKKYKILFVCLGNICRSPSAEAVFKGIVKKEGLEEYFEIDSAGTSGWHIGEPADQRMQLHAAKRNYHLTSLGRKFELADFEHFDKIIVMDNSNLHTLKQMNRNSDNLKKLYKMTNFCKKYKYNEVPDPYYEGAEGFELVLDLLEDSCEGLLENLKNS